MSTPNPYRPVPQPPVFPGEGPQTTPACRRLFSVRAAISRGPAFALVAGLVAAGCTVEPKDAGGPVVEVESSVPAPSSTVIEAPATTAAAPPETFVDPAPSSAVGPPSTAYSGDTYGYLAALSSVDPGELAKPDRAVDRGLNVCQEVEAGKPRDIVFRNAGLRFDLTNPALIEGVVSIAIVFLCPDAVLL